jgi:hypothetical protein
MSVAIASTPAEERQVVRERLVTVLYYRADGKARSNPRRLARNQ